MTTYAWTYLFISLLFVVTAWYCLCVQGSLFGFLYLVGSGVFLLFLGGELKRF